MSLIVFIGYDSLQPEAFDVCRHSIRKYAKKPVVVYPLKHRELREIGLFNRPWEITADKGTYRDPKDGRPFSTEFAHTRFLVPEYCEYLGVDIDKHRYALFVDSDFVFLKDINLITKHTKSPGNEDKPLYVVKHQYTPKSKVKMDAREQTKYSKKLWSSLMLFDLQQSNCGPTVDQVNSRDGSWLHSFSWLPNDEEIGGLPEMWNFIPDHSEHRTKKPPHAIHFTEGLPTYEGYKNAKFAEVYKTMLREVRDDKEKRDEF